MSYLIEVLKKEYGNTSEDRITQVFSATFNNSPLFRRIFLKFVKLNKTNANKCRAVTHRNYTVGSKDLQVDILILNERDTPVIVIENKIDSPLYSRQLKSYNKIQSFYKVRKLALVKHYAEPFDDVHNWIIYHWGDLLRHLDGYPDITESKERLLIGDFKEFLKEMGMERVNLIHRKDLKDLATFMYEVRKSNLPYLSLSNKLVFETANNYLMMLEEIVTMLSEERMITRRIRKKHKFSAYLGYDDKIKINPFIGTEIKLAREYGKIKIIGTGIYFNTKIRGKYWIDIFVTDKKYTYYDSMVYPFKNLDFDKYANMAIKFWRRKLNA